MISITMHGAVARWMFYAVTFGLLWGAVAQALIFRDGFWRCVIGGALAGMFFATVAVRRELRGVRRQLRRR